MVSCGSTGTHSETLQTHSALRVGEVFPLGLLPGQSWSLALWSGSIMVYIDVPLSLVYLYSGLLEMMDYGSWIVHC